MIKKVFSVYDREIRVYDTPIHVAHEAQAERAIFSLFDPQARQHNPFEYSYPSCELVHVADYDDVKGTFTNRDIDSPDTYRRSLSSIVDKFSPPPEVN